MLLLEFESPFLPTFIRRSLRQDARPENFIRRDFITFLSGYGSGIFRGPVPDRELKGTDGELLISFCNVCSLSSEVSSCEVILFISFDNPGNHCGPSYTRC